MIQIEKTDVYGWEAAIRGMRNPMNSWEKSDSGYCMKNISDPKACLGCDVYNDVYQFCEPTKYIIGPNDHELMMKLAKGGSVHAKYRRMITVTADITAPLYWWKEFDTYKVGTVANSCSTMHKIHAKEFTMDDFSHEHLLTSSMFQLHRTVDLLNEAREAFLDCTVSKYGTAKECEEVKKVYWWQMIQLLPSSYNQTRTIQMNYEVLVGMYRDRKNHKLDEWRVLCEWIEGLPYSELITGNE